VKEEVTGLETEKSQQLNQERNRCKKGRINYKKIKECMRKKEKKIKTFLLKKHKHQNKNHVPEKHQNEDTENGKYFIL